ncbi:MAG: F0F1 ATP synthase subunit B [Deltaproteobacteria bacterium]|nr:F0F1 ATP synthase subunit B [Deltaproteobacteria bacterium]
MGEALTALGLNIKIVIVQALGFLILLWLMKKFLFGRIQDIMHRRREEVVEGYEKNERARQELEELKKTYEESLANIEHEALQKMDQTVKESQKLAQEILTTTRQEADEMRGRAVYDINQEKKKALAEIRDEVVNLSMQLTTKMIQKSMDKKTAGKLVDDFIGEFGGLNP